MHFIFMVLLIKGETMKKKKIDFKIEDKYMLENFKNHYLLNIETTGFSRKRDVIFAISILKLEKNSNIDLYLIDDLEEEITMLNNLRNIKKVITYNGNSFHIPFIKERTKSLKSIFEIENNFDL